MKHLHLLPLSLAAVLLSGALIGCGDTAPDSVVTDSVSTAAVSETTTDSGYPAPNTDTLDFGGKELRIVNPEYGGFYRYFPEELTGDVVDDAAYMRLIDVQNALNVKIVAISDGSWGATTHQMVERSITAGDDAYDFIFTHCIYGISDYATQNMLYNLDDLPYLNFDAPWWSKEMIDNFRIGDETYYAFGDIILSDPSCILFNKDISEEYDFQDHYQRVRDNTWTYDVFLTEAKSISVDINGDGKIDENDKTGYAGDTTEALCNIPFACGIQLTKATDDGIELTFWSDKMLDVFNKTYDYFMDSTCCQGYIRSMKSGQTFDQGLALFTIASPGSMEWLRESDINFGALPLPKYDEDQESYRCYAWPCFVCVPTTIQDPELVGAGLELFAYESAPVRDAYFDVLIRGKSTRDEETLEMLDIIYASQVCDIGASYLGFDVQFHKVFYCFLELMRAKNNNIASHYEKSEKAIQKVLDNLYDEIIENQNNH